MVLVTCRTLEQTQGSLRGIVVFNITGDYLGQNVYSDASAPRLHTHTHLVFVPLVLLLSSVT